MLVLRYGRRPVQALLATPETRAAPGFFMVDFLDSSDDSTFVEKNRPFQVGQRFANIQTDTFWTTRVWKSA